MRIYFIGIGGIGTSALAQYYLKEGHKVFGSDLEDSEMISFLRKTGAKIKIGPHNKENLEKKIDLLIYSPAINFQNPELIQAKKRKIPCLSYPQALGELTKKYFTIAICGTHGKSTTATMVSLILIKAGFDPTVFVGTKVKEFSNSNRFETNFRKGNSKYLIVEADEWQASFLNYLPKLILLTNIEKEHLDFYKNFTQEIEGFKKFALKLPKDGTLIVDPQDSGTKKFLKELRKEKIDFRIKFIENNLIKKKLAKILKVPGVYNLKNALFAISLAKILGISEKIAFSALSKFEGSWRRFQIKKIRYNQKEITLILDYAHHPTEIKATVEGLKEKFPKKEIFIIFQPHQYQRTFYLKNEFIKAFRFLAKKRFLKKIIITKIYEVAGREKKKIKEKITSKQLVKEIAKKKVIFLEKEKIKNFIKNNFSKNSIFVLMGAGDIYQLFPN